MSDYEYYKVNAPHVVHEVIDGEAVLVNMNNGYYYSLDDAGADIWNLIEQGNSVAQIENLLSHHYIAPETEIKNGLNDLIQNLLSEELIIGQTEPQNGAASGNNKAENSTEKKPFSKPILQKYTDMEDLLLLDPIHDVDEESGWPNKNPETK